MPVLACHYAVSATPASISTNQACNAMVGGLSTSAWEPMCNEEEEGGSSVIEHNFSFAEPEDHPETLGLLADAVSTPQLLIPSLLGQGMLAPTPGA